MLSDFQDFNQKHQLFDADQTVLLALSGGLDSTAMCRLFHLAGQPFAIAHCNFQLRGIESDKDETLCKTLAEYYQVPFYSIRFETIQLAQEEKESIQLIARKLRYDWLEKIRTQNQYASIATAHHLDDSIETFIYNFAKGTGIRGLTGIPIKNGKIIRPLLFASRQQLEIFAERQNLNWREDASNAEDKYHRNKIRHHIVPILEHINPALQHSSARTFDHLRETQQLSDWASNNLREQMVETTSAGLQIQIDKLRSYPFFPTLLFEWLKTFGFHGDQVQQLADLIRAYPKHHIGAGFQSSSHEILLDRSHILVQTKTESLQTVYQLPNLPPGNTHEAIEIELTNGIFVAKQGMEVPSSFPQTAYLAYLQFHESDFPLQLRHWKAGDVFQPLGMKGKHQKVQDFFTNQKVTRFEKDRIWLLETANKEIAWIVGYRIDHRFRLTPNTKFCYQLQFKPNTT
ncbi:MAG: tRNA lysidine(34) synthetase TilS [Saprospiraceae bacterium]|nr:tRNA lysidine(34) synthetase TilS [Saprospiraceae bacterium]